MLSELSSKMLSWWSALPPGPAFLFALPFVLAIIGLVGDWLGRRRSARRMD